MEERKVIKYLQTGNFFLNISTGGICISTILNRVLSLRMSLILRFYSVAHSHILLTGNKHIMPCIILSHTNGDSNFLFVFVKF